MHIFAAAKYMQVRGERTGVICTCCCCCCELITLRLLYGGEHVPCGLRDWIEKSPKQSAAFLRQSVSRCVAVTPLLTPVARSCVCVRALASTAASAASFDVHRLFLSSSTKNTAARSQLDVHKVQSSSEVCMCGCVRDSGLPDCCLYTRIVLNVEFSCPSVLKLQIGYKKSRRDAMGGLRSHTRKIGSGEIGVALDSA